MWLGGPIRQRPRRVTLACRVVCSALVAAPLYYVNFVGGSAAQFLILLLLAPPAGLVLIANSLYCLVGDRKFESWWIGLVFILIGSIGFVEAWHYLPQFRM